MNKIAVFAGTFDPFTLGHQYVAEKAAELFDELYVVIGKSSKTPEFHESKRLELLKFNLMHLKNVKIADLGDGLLGTFAEKVGAKYLIKGIRSGTDFDYEKATQRVMEDTFPGLETFYVIPPRDHEHISSTMVRGFLNFPEREKLVSPYISNLTNFVLFRDSSHGALYQIQFLKERWDKIYYNSKRTGNFKKEFFDKEFFNLINLYTSKDRYYHTIDHLFDCLFHLTEGGSFFLEIELALFFHDAIYDPRGNDNEEKSAEMADQFMKRVGFNLEVRNKVKRLIMVTNHKIDPENGEENVIVEVDTAIFADHAKFWVYEKNIRKEYAFVPEKEYAKARISILQKFVDQGFRYAFLNNVNSEVAKMHLKQAIEKLQEILKKK